MVLRDFEAFTAIESDHDERGDCDYERSSIEYWSMLMSLIRWLDGSRLRVPWPPAGHCSAAVAQATEVALLTAFHFSWFPRPPLASVGRSIIRSLDYGSILYWAVALTGHFIEYLRRYHLERVQKSELQAQLA